MATEVLLLASVEGLGDEGAVVRVSDGYARNYLFPRSLGAPVTEATRRKFAKLQVRREADLKEALASSQEMAAKLESVSCTIPVKTGEDEKLYGSVTAAQVADVLKGQGVELDRHQLALDEPIRELGVFTIPVKLHPDVEASVRVWVVEE